MRFSLHKITSLYGELYIKDIVERNGIEREDLLEDILDFLASQIGSLTNPANIANTISSMRNEKINQSMAANYIKHTIDSFLISRARRYDIKGKSYFNYPNKYYYTDIGLRNARLNLTKIFGKQHKAMVFIDYEYCFYSYKRVCDIKPQPAKWMKLFEADYSIADVMVFDDFSPSEINSELGKIRNITNTIIETFTENAWYLMTFMKLLFILKNL